MKLAASPLCERCLAMNPQRITAAVEAHHLRAVKEHEELKLCLENLESLCTSCHSRITRVNNNKQ